MNKINIYFNYLKIKEKFASSLLRTKYSIVIHEMLTIHDMRSHSYPRKILLSKKHVNWKYETRAIKFL